MGSDLEGLFHPGDSVNSVKPLLLSHLPSWCPWRGGKEVILNLPTFPTRERRNLERVGAEGPAPVLAAMGRLFLGLLALLKALESVRALAGYVT